MAEQNGLTVQQKELAVGRRGVQLTSFEDAWRFATAVIQSKMAPPGYTTAQQVLIGIQRGAEVGLPPMQALDVIAVINNRPTVYGDGIPALVESSGQLANAKEWIDGEGDNRTAHCRVWRRGQDEPLERTFSVADAKRAKLWGKTGPWTQYPDRMLTMRARAFAYRDKFADCLRGLQVREEVEDYGGTVPAEVTEPDRPRLLSEVKSEELPADVPEPDSFHAIKLAISAVPEGDADALDSLWQDIERATDGGRLTEMQFATLCEAWRAKRGEPAEV